MTPDLKQTFRWENIPAAVSALRADGQTPFLRDQVFEGGQCMVFRVDFSDGESWAVRVPIHMKNTPDTIKYALQAEARVLRQLEKTSFGWAPRYHGSSLTFDNPIGFPFIALGWIEGSPLTWTATEPPRPVRNRLLAQLAAIQISLVECTKEQSTYA